MIHTSTRDDTTHDTKNSAFARLNGAIDKAQAILLRTPPPHVDVDTAKFYETNVARMLSAGKMPADYKGSYRSVNRASLVYVGLTALQEKLSDLFNVFDRDDVEEVSQAAAVIEIWLDYLRRYPARGIGCKRIVNTQACGVSAPEVLPADEPTATYRKRLRTSKSKSLGLNTLPDGWPTQTIALFKNDPQMYLPVIITRLTGLRPSELARGVTVMRLSNTIIRVTIIGSKVTPTSGQRTRALDVAVATCRYAGFIEAIDAADPLLGLTIKIDSPQKFSDRIRYETSKIFRSYRISAYSFRHLVSAELKAAGYSRDMIAKALGHYSATSQRHYAKAREGKKSQTGILRATASRDVKHLDQMRLLEPVKDKAARTLAKRSERAVLLQDTPPNMAYSSPP